MTQIILDLTHNNIMLPESIRGYRAWEDTGGEEIEMISRRLVREVRGTVWRATYQYGWFDDDTKNAVIESCMRGQREAISCAILPPQSNSLIVSDFAVVSFNFPTFMWSRETIDGTAVPLWADFALELREVSPHD